MKYIQENQRLPDNEDLNELQANTISSGNKSSND